MDPLVYDFPIAAKSWEIESGQQNDYPFEEGSCYLTRKGERVRSRAELIIADILAELKLPYKYEASYYFENGRHCYPDFTILEGVEGTIYGHYPVTALADQAVLPLRVLVAGKNVVATDMVGARIYGLTLDDVPHLKLAVEKGYSDGVMSLDDIDIQGDISMYNTKYPTDLYDCYPPDVKVIKGKKRCCKQGCQNNPLTLLQILYNDHQGKGGWTMVMGMGHDPEEIDAIEGKVLIVGDCAINEVGDRLIERLGKKNVYLSHKCNSLADSAAAMFHLMDVDPMVFVPIPLPKALWCLTLSKLHGSTALVPNPFSNKFKTV